MIWITNALHFFYIWFIYALDFLNLLEDQAPNKTRRLSLTNVSFWAALIFAAFVVIKCVITVDAPDMAEFGLVAVSSVIAALLRERKSQRCHDRHGGSDDEV
nr:hypothetical protein [Brevundimonas naejangsanensis]